MDLSGGDPTSIFLSGFALALLIALFSHPAPPPPPPVVIATSPPSENGPSCTGLLLGFGILIVVLVVIAQSS